MKRFLLISMITIIIFVGGGYFYISQKLNPQTLPSYVHQTENALAMKNLLMIGHIDVDYAARIESLAYGKGDPLPLIDKNDDKNSIFSTLRQNGIDLRKDINQISIGFFVTDKKPVTAMIIHGQFNPSKIELALSTSYITTPLPNKKNVLSLIRKDKDTCRLADPLIIKILPNRIIVADPEIINEVIQRIESNAVAEIDLKNWNSFRHNKIFSFGILTPQESYKAIPNPFFSMMARSVTAKKDPSVNSAFLGASVQMSYPVGITIDTHINSDNSDWVKETHKSIEDARINFRKDASETFPTLAKLDQYLNVNTTESALQFDITMNQETLHDIGDVFKEVMSSLFSGMGLSSSMANNQDVQEKLVKPSELIKYETGYGFAQIPNFVPEDHMFLKTDTTTGPFGIMVSSAKIIDNKGDDGKLVQLTLKIGSSDVKNIAEGMHIMNAENAPARIIITGVYDTKGLQLLRAEDCGQDKNLSPAKLEAKKNYSYNGNTGTPTVTAQLDGTKTIRLIKEANLDHIAKIEGKIIFELPTDIITKRLKAPLEGQVIQTDNMRLYMKQGKNTDLNYEISGKAHHLLNIRPLNAKGEILYSPGGSSSQGMFQNGGRNVSRNVQGIVSGVEIIYTSKTQTKEYPFSFGTFLNHFETSTYGKKPYRAKEDTVENFKKSAKKYDFSDYCKDSTPAKLLPPLRLCLKDLKDNGVWGISTGFSLAAPLTKGLTQNLTGLEIVVTDLKIKDKNGQKYYEPFTFREFIQTDTSSMNSNKAPYLENKYINMSKRPKNRKRFKDLDIYGIKGYIAVRIPQKIKTKALSLRQLGNHMTTRDKSLFVQLTEISKDKITLKVAGKISKLIQIIPTTQKNESLPVSNISIEKNKNDKYYTVTIQPVGGQPAFIHVAYATRNKTLKYAFSVNKPESKQ